MARGRGRAAMVAPHNYRRANSTFLFFLEWDGVIAYFYRCIADQRKERRLRMYGFSRKDR